MILLLWFVLFYVLVLNFCTVAPDVRFYILVKFRLLSGYLLIDAHSTYNMFYWLMYKYMYRIVILVFSHLGVWSGDFFLIASFPHNCLFLPYCNTLMLRHNRHYFNIYQYKKHLGSSIFFYKMGYLSFRETLSYP